MKKRRNMSNKFSNEELAKMREEFEWTATYDMNSNELIDEYVELKMQTLKDDERDYYIECGWLSDDEEEENND